MRRTIATPVLVLNAAYEALTICSAKKALKLWAKKKAEIQEVYDHPFYRGMLLPAVIRLVHYRHIPPRKYEVSRKNILMRDRHTCQYCRKKFPPAKLELEHVLPRSRGGGSTWDNLVASCHTCNNRKANRTPDEAGMPLMVRPKSMNLHVARNMIRNMGEEESTWRHYLYY